MNLHILIIIILKFCYNNNLKFYKTLKSYKMLLSNENYINHNENIKIIYFSKNSNCYKTNKLNISLIAYNNNDIVEKLLDYSILNLNLYSHINYFNFKQNQNTKNQLFDKNEFPNPILIDTNYKVIFKFMLNNLEY